jgi:hypothetical protein
MFIPRQYVEDFFNMLNEHSVNYALIKNIGNELPEKLPEGKDIDILVHPESKQLFENIMLDNNYHTHTPPLGISNGWNFGYGLPEYQFWKKENIPCDFYIDASFALCCKSLVPKTWIPLDRKINENVWGNKVFDKQNNCWKIDDRNLLVYLLVRCIFDKQYFSEAYIQEIEKLEELLFDSYVQEALKLVFFKFTPKLIELLKDRKYASAINEYISFKEY